MRIRSIVLPLSLLMGALLVPACKGDDDGGELPACPTGGTMLTYDNFGKDFFNSYCTSCHSGGSGVSEAQDKPFDSQADIQAHAGQIYSEAGGTNTGMPPSGTGPTADERTQLAEWLSCGAK